MKLRKNARNGPLMRAALHALETSNADHILIWVPEEYENTMKNLLEKACCERTVRKNAHNQITDWYFKTARRLHSLCYGPHDLNISTKTPEEKKIILLVESACQSGNFAEMNPVIPDTADDKLRRDFNNLLNRKNFDPANKAAGRLYVSVLSGFVAQVMDIRSGYR